MRKRMDPAVWEIQPRASRSRSSAATASATVQPVCRHPCTGMRWETNTSSFWVQQGKMSGRTQPRTRPGSPSCLRAWRRAFHGLREVCDSQSCFAMHPSRKDGVARLIAAHRIGRGRHVHQFIEQRPERRMAGAA